MELQNAHFIRLRFHGPTNYKPSRYSATWAGWASDDCKPVRVYISGQLTAEQAAKEAACAFRDWLCKGYDGNGKRTHDVTGLQMGFMPGPDYAVLVRLTARP